MLGSVTLSVLLLAAFALQQYLNAQQRTLVRGKVDALQSTMGAGGFAPCSRDFGEPG